MAHTPGPWVMIKQDSSVWSADGKQVAHCQSKAGCGMTWDKSILDANARIIAAAPDLIHAIVGDHGDRLSFLESLINECDKLSVPERCDLDAWTITLDEAHLFIREAKAAIAKATGEL